MTEIEKYLAINQPPPRIKKAFLALIGLWIIFTGCDNGISDNGISFDDPAIPDARTEQWWIDRHTAKANPVIQNQKIIFIGDSITHAWEGTEAWAALNAKYNNKITNLGFSGDQVQNVIWRLENGEFPVGINPEYVVLMIGTNNGNAPESTAAGIWKIIQIINKNSQAAKIILSSILPRGSGSNDVNSIRNAAINEIIKSYNGRLNVLYLNLWPHYIRDTGELKDELFDDIKVHLTAEGFNIWKEKLIEIIGD
ncbi:MAG: GDSL-type esterase/lipase family protein [Spirochaetales bacterium]|jgi:lysophospholipase L1-like esterase|nr:GDSL-type esterase/lipase family protein [Spirochaetales bacterium]